MGQIFLSYAREDRPIAERLARVLEDAGHEVWWDRRLDGGEEFSTEIEAALAQSNAVLVAWSKTSIKSRWVRDEAAVGGDSGRLVPVSVDGSLPPMGFRQFHTLDLSGWRGGKNDERTSELLHSLDRRLNGAAGAAVRAEKPRHHRLSRSRAISVAAALVVLLGAVGVFFFVNRSGNAPSSPPSVALLPFTADASDADAGKLASAAHDAVAHTLSQGAFALDTPDVPPQRGQPKSDFLISGHVTSTPQNVVATVRMEETAHHVVVFSHQFEATRDKAWDLPEQIGAQVASQISWTAPLIALERRHPSDPAIVASLLQGSTAGMEGSDVLHDYETARRLAAKNPDSPLAQNNLAFDTAFALDLLPRDQRAEAIATARKAADRTIELAPEYGSAYVPWCLLHSFRQMAGCEDRLRTGMRLDPDDPFAGWFLSRLLNDVGRVTEAADLARVSLAHDEYMPYKIGHMIRMLEVTGKADEAAQLYEKSLRWWPNSDEIRSNVASGMIDRGDFEALQHFYARTSPAAARSPVLSALNRTSLPALQAACSSTNGFDTIICMLGLARLGDLDAAYRIAGELFPPSRGRTPAEEDRIWMDNPPEITPEYITSPAAAPLRRDLRYLELADRAGVLDYWRRGRPPDFCKPPNPEAICAYLLKPS